MVSELNNRWKPFVANYGWGGLDNDRPQNHRLIDIRKGDDGAIETLPPAQIHPMMNVYGWYWRPSVFGSEGKTIEGTVNHPSGITAR